MYLFCHPGTGRIPDQLLNLDMKHGVEAKNYEEVSRWYRCWYRCWYRFKVKLKCTHTLAPLRDCLFALQAQCLGNVT